MPDYTIRDPQTGRTVTLRGESPPTEQELEQVFASLKPAALPKDALMPPVPDPLARVPIAGRGSHINLQDSYDTAGGVRAGAARTVFGGGDLLRRAWNAVVPQSMEVERVINTPEAQEAMTPPDSPRGRMGMYAEQAAEFALPLARVSKAVSGTSLLTKAAAEGATSAGVAGVQSAGDPTTMATAGALGAAGPVAGKVVAGTFGAARRAAAGAKEGGIGGAVAGAIRSAAPSEPKTMLVQGLKPRATKVHFEQSLDRAIPEIKAAEQAIGKPVENIDDLLNATKAAKQGIQRQLNTMRGAQRAITAHVDLSPVADAMEASIPKKLALENPQAAERLRAAAQTYRNRFSLDDAEQLLRETNAELDSFFAKYPPGQRAALTADPQAAQLYAQAKSMRDAIYRTLDRPGQGEAARELNRRYGALLDIEDAAWRRSNVAKRQQPESLSEQIGKVRAAADMARGTWRLLHGDVSGAADLLAAKAGRETATFLKEQQTTDALIKRAFAGYRGSPSAVTMPQPPQIRGLLSAGEPPMPKRQAIPLPGDVAPDPSGVKAVAAAPLAYEINPMVPVKSGGVRVSQFAGDPEAARAAVATPEVRSMLERMLKDLQIFTPQRGKLVQRSLDSSDSYYAYGGPGSPVGDDIRVISEQNVGNSKIAGAIRDLLEGRMPSNRLHTAALDAAMGYLEKRPGYRGPSVPGAADEAVDPDFEAFSRMVDDVADEP